MKSRLILGFLLMACTACQPPSAVQASGEKQKVDGFFISTGNLPVGWMISDVKGFGCRVFQYNGTGDYMEKFNGALEGLKSNGSELGANAFLNFSVSSESHEIQGSKWHASIVHLCGDYAVIK